MTEGCDYYFKCEDSIAKLQGTKNDGPITPQKGHCSLPVTEPKDMEIYDLPIKNSKQLFTET